MIGSKRAINLLSKHTTIKQKCGFWTSKGWYPFDKLVKLNLQARILGFTTTRNCYSYMHNLGEKKHLQKASKSMLLGQQLLLIYPKSLLCIIHVKLSNKLHKYLHTQEKRSLFRTTTTSAQWFIGLIQCINLFYREYHFIILSKNVFLLYNKIWRDSFSNDAFENVVFIPNMVVCISRHWLIAF